MSGEIPAELKNIADLVSRGRSPGNISVRALLVYFGAQRRGIYVVQRIRDALDELGIETRPDFADLWIDAEIEIVPKAGVRDEAPAREDAEQTTGLIGSTTPEAPAARMLSDPTLRIKRLPAANQPIVSVSPTDELSVAVTKMLQHGFSQLPIMTSERDVKGIISWSSIGTRIALNCACDTVRQCREDHLEVDRNESILDVITLVNERGYVLVRGQDRKITGIVTASDLGLQFQQLAEPFLLLGEIEQHIREIMSDKVPLEDLKRARDPADSERAIERIADLTLGECLRVIEAESNWTKLGLGKIDRKTFISYLEAVRKIRNDVMHFDPDPLDEADLHKLRSFSTFLRKVQGARSM